MPELFQGICSNCGHKTAVMTGGYGAVLVDHPIGKGQHEVAGAVFINSAAGPIAEASDPRFIVLSHPIEESILWRQAQSLSSI